MALQHSRALLVQFLVKRLNDPSVAVADIVNAISRKNIEDATPFRCIKLRPDAPFIADVHLEHVEQLGPFLAH